ncbi:nucleotide-binding universal stress UspA family protein [Sinorhizobium fredii]
MTYKTILLVIDPTQYETDLRAAADLCAAANAHLSVLLVKLAAPPPIGDYAALSVAWLDERASDIEQLDKAVEIARTTLKDLRISFEVDGMYTERAWADNEIGERARYADVTLIGASLSFDAPLRVRSIDGALFYSARPVLFAAHRQSVTLLPKRILLAWNSSLEAARAAREALEIMKRAEEVNVVLVDPTAASARNGEEPGADIATYLARHGIKVTVDRLPSAGRRVEEVLNQHAVDSSADLIVMGAYGHSRVREKVFGFSLSKPCRDAPHQAAAGFKPPGSHQFGRVSRSDQACMHSRCHRPLATAPRIGQIPGRFSIAARLKTHRSEGTHLGSRASIDLLARHGETVKAIACKGIVMGTI